MLAISFQFISSRRFVFSETDVEIGDVIIGGFQKGGGLKPRSDQSMGPSPTGSTWKSWFAQPNWELLRKELENLCFFGWAPLKLGRDLNHGPDDILIP